MFDNSLAQQVSCLLVKNGLHVAYAQEHGNHAIAAFEPSKGPVRGARDTLWGNLWTTGPLDRLLRASNIRARYSQGRRCPTGRTLGRRSRGELFGDFG